MKVLKDLSLLLMLLGAGSLVACSSDEEGSADNPNILTEFTPSQASTIYFSNGIDFGANAGEQEITFTSNKSWSVSSTVGWCRAVSDRGSAGDASFRIVVDENPSYESREGVLTLKVGELNNYITVRQGGVGSARIHVEEAGTLPALLGDDYEQITDLTLTGELNGTDFKFLRDNSFWNRLQKLNLTDARIVAGGERYYTGMPNYLQSDTLSYCLLWGYQFVELQLPSTIKAIGMQSLGGCSNLKSIVIPESVTSIGDHAFSACYDLESVNIPQHLVEIGAGAFSQCTSLKQLQLPQSLSYISNSLFSGCSNLQSIEIPLSVDSVAAGAFYGCKSLTKLVIPESVQYIEGGTWEGCSSLTTLEYHTKNIPWVSCLEYPPVNEIIIGEEVEEIESFAFLGFTELRTLTIPATVKGIGSSIFGSSFVDNSNNMESLHMLSSTPPEIESFSYSLGDVNQCTLYVPRGAKTRYESVGEPWTDFKAIIEE